MFYDTLFDQLYVEVWNFRFIFVRFIFIMYIFRSNTVNFYYLRNLCVNQYLVNKANDVIR